MLRKLAIAIAASGAMMSASTTYALGMGDIELDSALNQPLDARIKLLKASELEDWEIKPNLASRDEFEKSGVERVFFLNSFRFEVERTDSGVFVNITSELPVKEPFLNFLVQVDWPSGRLLREYTVLLDPPVFTQDQPQSVSAPKSEPYDNYDTESEDLYEELPQSSLPGMAADQSDDDMDEEEVQAPVVSKKPVAKKPKKYAVRKNDTLWEVAILTRENRSISPQQAMLAIQDLNPSAFINGNINRLKRNQVLRVPTKEEMLSRSFSQAVSEVALQNQAIAKRKAQLDATRKEKMLERDTSAPDARLKLLAGGDATTEAKRGASGKVDKKAVGDQSSLENDLNLALENLDKSNLENNELRTRLDSLEDQINTLQRLVNLKDEQMVALQTGIGSKASKPVKPEVPVKVIDKPVTAPLDDLNFAEPAAKPPVAEVKPVEKKLKPVVPKPVPAPIVEEEPFDVISFASENPAVPGVILAALLGGLLLSKRIRKRKEEAEESVDGAAFDGQDPLDDVNADLEDDFNSEFDELDLGGSAAEAEFAESDFDGADFSDDGLDDFDAADGSLPDSLDGTDLGEGQDILGEVDVYMAYNRAEPARELLEKTLQQQPGRMELRTKLLEVLSEMDDQEAFNEHFDYVMENGQPADQSQAESIKSAFGLAESADLSDDFGLGLESDGGIDSLGLDADAGELDFDLEGLDLNADPDTPLQDNNAQEFEGDSSLDFDMDLSDFDSDTQGGLEITPVTDLDTADNSLDFDSSLDDDLASLGADSVASDLDDDFESLDLDADLSDGGLGSLDDDNGLSFETSSDNSLDDDLDLEGFDVPSLSDELTDIELPNDELEFEGLDVPSLSVDELDSSGLDADDLDLSDLEVPSLSVTEDAFDIDLDDADLDDADLDSLSQLNNELDNSSMSSDLETLDDLVDDSDLQMLGEADNLTEVESVDLSENASLDDDLADLEESLDLEMPEVADSSELDALDELVADADAFDGAAESNRDLVSLDELGTDDLPALGDMDLDNLGEDLDFLSGTDESETKLDLARAYIDMDDKDGAREILQEVLEEGTDQQKGDASKLMDSMA
jgi:pilus assembly protein FimV